MVALIARKKTTQRRTPTCRSAVLAAPEYSPAHFLPIAAVVRSGAAGQQKRKGGGRERTGLRPRGLDEKQNREQGDTFCSRPRALTGRPRMNSVYGSTGQEGRLLPAALHSFSFQFVICCASSVRLFCSLELLELRKSVGGGVRRSAANLR